MPCIIKGDLNCCKCEHSTFWLKKNHFSCVADPLADLRLVSLWKDVDVGLEGAGFNHSFVSVGQKQNPAEDGEQLLMLASRKLQADCFQHRDSCQH